jgi:hypothetical protein
VVGSAVATSSAYYEAVGATRGHGAVRFILEGPSESTSLTTWKDLPQVRLSWCLLPKLHSQPTLPLTALPP